MMSRGALITSCKRDLIDIYNHAVEAVKPDNLIRNAVSIKDNRLVVKDCRNGDETAFDLSNTNIHLVGGGKSVMSMAYGVAQLAKQAGINDRFTHGHLSLPIGLKGSLEENVTMRDYLKSIDVKCLFGSRDNLPDESSVKASKSILEGVQIACDNDRKNCLRPFFLVLISGGGSACLTSPRFIDLQEKLNIIKFLVQKGANIVELNKVRRYYSSIKGGGLARHMLKCHPESRIVTLILSDVIGDPVEYIASGPTYLSRNEESSAARLSMLDILRKYNYTDIQTPLSISDIDIPVETVPLNVESNIRNIVIGNNTLALTAAIKRAQNLGYNVELIGNNLEGSSDKVVDRISRFGIHAFSRYKNNVFVIGGGEVTISKLNDESWGKGGRAQEMALDYLIARLSRETSGPEGAVDIFMAGSTDGQDGPTDVAACMSSQAELNAGGNELLSLDKLLRTKRTHSSYDFWSKYRPDWLVKTGLTGTNVMDLYMYLLRKE